MSQKRRQRNQRGYKGKKNYKLTWNPPEVSDVEQKMIQSEYTNTLKDLKDKGQFSMSLIKEKKHEMVNVEYKGKKYEFTVYVFKKGEFVYKASAQLYTEVRQRSKKLDDFLWFGSGHRAYSFASLGLPGAAGIHVFEILKDIKIIDVSVSQNIENILDMLRADRNNQGVNTIIKKFGYKLSLDQIIRRYILSSPKGYIRAQKVPDIWVYTKLHAKNKIKESDQYIKDYLVINDDIKILGITSSTHFDRSVMRVICPLVAPLGLDGILIPQIYTPLYNNGIWEEELVICSPENKIARKADHPANWFGHKNTFPNIGEDFFLSETSKFRRARQDTDFYLRNIKLYDKFVAKPKKGFRVLSSNVHQFISINQLDTPEKSMLEYVKALQRFEIDLAVCQEGAINRETMSWGGFTERLSQAGFPHSFRYTTEREQRNISRRFDGIMIFSKYPLKDIKEIKLPNDVKHTLRKGIIFRVDNPSVSNLLLATTHLEIGFYSDENSLVALNQLTRMKQMAEIAKHKPDVIFGDFNFNRGDKEYQLLTKTLSEYGNKNGETTPFETTVDFFFFREGLKPRTIGVIPYPYSDHNFVYVDL